MKKQDSMGRIYKIQTIEKDAINEAHFTELELGLEELQLYVPATTLWSIFYDGDGSELSDVYPSKEEHLKEIAETLDLKELERITDKDGREGYVIPKKEFAQFVWNVAATDPFILMVHIDRNFFTNPFHVVPYLTKEVPDDRLLVLTDILFFLYD